MKGRLAAFVGVFCIALFVVSGAYAGKPDKKGKPPRPGNIAVECITFLGPDRPDLVGHQQVVGCCPNAGPFPAYRMTLDLVGIVDGTYDGHLFAKPVRTKFKGQTTRRYKVQFNTWDWETEIPGDDDYFIEMYSDGDDIDETDNVLTVTFNNDHVDDTATVWVYYDMNDCDPCDPTCIPCVDFEPTCDDLCDPDCRHPCNEKITIENVSFTMTKTTDLNNCPVVVVE